LLNLLTVNRQLTLTVLETYVLGRCNETEEERMPLLAEVVAGEAGLAWDAASHGRGAGGPVTDCYYSPDEWSRLSPDDQQRVRDLRAQRDRVQGMSAVALYNERNVRPRIEQIKPHTPAQVDSDATTISSNLSGSGIGDRMSQR
jgi:hypothetical protein